MTAPVEWRIELKDGSEVQIGRVVVVDSHASVCAKVCRTYNLTGTRMFVVYCS